MWHKSPSPKLRAGFNYLTRRNVRTPYDRNLCTALNRTFSSLMNEHGIWVDTFYTFFTFFGWSMNQIEFALCEEKCSWQFSSHDVLNWFASPKWIPKWIQCICDGPNIYCSKCALRLSRGYVLAICIVYDNTRAMFMPSVASVIYYSCLNMTFLRLVQSWFYTTELTEVKQVLHKISPANKLLKLSFSRSLSDLSGGLNIWYHNWIGFAGVTPCIISSCFFFTFALFLGNFSSSAFI